MPCRDFGSTSRGCTCRLASGDTMRYPVGLLACLLARGKAAVRHKKAVQLLRHQNAILHFIIPSGLSIGLQNYCRNDNAPGLVSMVVVVTTICNILGGWLLIYPLKMGTKGAAIATGVSQTIGLLILLTRFSR